MPCSEACLFVFVQGEKTGMRWVLLCVVVCAIPHSHLDDVGGESDGGDKPHLVEDLLCVLASLGCSSYST